MYLCTKIQESQQDMEQNLIMQANGDNENPFKKKPDNQNKEQKEEQPKREVE